MFNPRAVSDEKQSLSASQLTASASDEARNTLDPTPAAQISEEDKRHYEHALRCAASDGNFEELKRCVTNIKKFGCNIDAIGGLLGFSALHCAAAAPINAVCLDVFILKRKRS